MKYLIFLLMLGAIIAFSSCQKDNSIVGVSDISLNKNKITISVGETELIITTITPGEATNKNVTWSSSKPAVATINSATGEVNAISVGETILTVTTADGNKTAMCTVIVTAAPVAVTGITLDLSTFSLKETTTGRLTATILPIDATNKKIVWSSKNENIAKVDDTGLVSAIAVGTTSIIATTADGQKTAECKVSITAAKTTPIGSKKATKASIGDFYFSDGTLESHEATLTDDQKSGCIGIVYWLGDIRKDNYGLLDSKLPERMHGLVVSLNVLTDIDQSKSQKMRWTNGQTNEQVSDWLTNSQWNGNITRPEEFVSIQNQDKMQGYANTLALQEYNEVKENESNINDKIVKPIQALYSFVKKHPTPKNSSGWYWPSISELQPMCWGQGNEQDTAGWQMLNKQLKKVGGKEFDDSGWLYWSSTEHDKRAQSAMGVYFVGGSSYFYDKGSRDAAFVRPILAF